MLCLGYVDTLYLSSALVIFSVPLLWPRVENTWTFTNLITVLLPAAHISLNGKDWTGATNILRLMIVSASILLTMCLALERWITVCFPFFKLRHR